MCDYGQQPANYLCRSSICFCFHLDNSTQKVSKVSLNLKSDGEANMGASSIEKCSLDDKIESSRGGTLHRIFVERDMEEWI